MMDLPRRGAIFSTDELVVYDFITIGCIALQYDY